MNVLLVENESETRSNLTTILEIRRHHVAVYDDAESGWTAYEAENHPLVIVGCSLIGGGGLELCQNIRKTQTGNKSLILAITASTRFGNLWQVLAAGADDYLETPIDLHHLSIRLTIAEQRVNALQQQAANIESLRENEQRLSLALQSTGYGYWDWNLRTGEVIPSKAGKAMFGIADEETGNNITEWETRIHLDDKPRWKEVLRTIFHKKADKFSIQYRVRCKDGSWKWILTHCIVANKAGNGSELHLIGTHIDISAQKNTGQELQFADYIYQAVGDAVMITDSSDRIIAVNHGFTELTGFASNDAIGKTPDFIYSSRHDDAFKQLLWHKLHTTGIWEGEIWSRHKNGAENAVWQLIRTIYDNNGKVLKRVTLFSDVTDQKRTEEGIRRNAYYDLLTGIPNRRLFQDRLELEIKKANRTNRLIAMMIVDLDRFKEVNDRFGHDVGDILLQEAARRISTCVRESDTVSRLGGDEFAAVLPELPDIGHADDVAQKILTKLSEPYRINGEIIHIEASIGISIYPNDAKNISSLMKNADQAMYIAKSRGRNQFSHFSISLPQAEQTRLHLINDLRGALAAKQLRVYFQPIVDLSTGRIHKAEALLRWQHPTRGMVSPMEFIPIAEEMGLINQIGDWVLNESARFAKHWSKQFSGEFQVSVHISPAQFKDDRRKIAAEWLRQLRELGLPGKNMVAEISEELLLDADPRIMDKLLEFRDAGIQAAIDDFQVAIDDSGVDYSSLAKYKELGIDYLKIDRLFMLNYVTDLNDLALSEIIVMAHKFGLKVIAEGVETEGQRDLLAAANCDYAQGKLYSMPVLGEEFEALLQHDSNARTQTESSLMSETSVHPLLSEQEAAAFLQPYMPGKSAAAWLAHDRQRDPIVSYYMVQGRPYYRESDLQNFVTRTLNTSARFVRLNNRLVKERRNRVERRRVGDLGLKAGGALKHGIKRRRRDDLKLRLPEDVDFRPGDGLDRRARFKKAMH
ncbi:MAG: EAL domain-containing protein [Gallionella sp.]